MKTFLTFDDVLIAPQFSWVKSRRDVSLLTKLGLLELKIPVISSNMTSVTGATMTRVLNDLGAVGSLPRFMSIEDNVTLFKESAPNTIGSIGLGEKEFERGVALVEAGCKTLLIDVAHGASKECLDQFNRLSQKLPYICDIIVGNFATKEEINTFLSMSLATPAAFKVGIGGGSACTTRIKTGCGIPTLGSVMDCAESGQVIIADGGIKTPGDIAKALAAGADAVMLGGMLSGTRESPPVQNHINSLITDRPELDPEFIKNINFWGSSFEYYGSASQRSYEEQGKTEAWRTAEGESFTVPYKGPVSKVIQDIEGGLRSAFTYVNARNLQEFQQKAKLIQITSAGMAESVAHGKKS
jgi:IMP dehydrogenase